MQRKKRIYHGEEKLDRWIVSYADFITLLFAFFVVMFAASNINEGKLEEVTQSLIEAFKTTPRALEPIQVGEVSRSPNDKVIPTELTAQADDGETQFNNLKVLSDKIESQMMDLIAEDQITVRRSENWLEIEINESILFGSGSINLVGSSSPVLQKIANILAPFPNPINVEGFTDNIPINTRKFRSNWELSAARAATVVHLFSKEGIEPSRMSAIGYGQFRPVADNSTAQGRQKNRRVVVAILADESVLPEQRHKQTLPSPDNSTETHTGVSQIAH